MYLLLKLDSNQQPCTCRFLIGPREVHLPRSLGGVRGRDGAVRCGQNCGHVVAAWRLALAKSGAHLAPRSAQAPLASRSAPRPASCSATRLRTVLVGAGSSCALSSPLSSALSHQRNQCLSCAFERRDGGFEPATPCPQDVGVGISAGQIGCRRCAHEWLTQVVCPCARRVVLNGPRSLSSTD